MEGKDSHYRILLEASCKSIGRCEEEIASALSALREKAFAEIQNLSKSFKNLPHGWENGALTLIGFPILSHPILAEKSE